MFDWMTRPESTTISLGTQRREGRRLYKEEKEKAKVLRAQQKADYLQAKKEIQNLRSHDYAVEQLKGKLLDKVREYDDGSQEFLENFRQNILNKHNQYIQDLRGLVSALKVKENYLEKK